MHRHRQGRTNAKLRWANNTLTTNGAVHTTTVTAISFATSGEGVSTGSASGVANNLEQVAALVKAAEAAARAAEPAEDAAPLAIRPASHDWDLAPGHTDIGVFADMAPRLGAAFGRSADAGRLLYGFVNHQIETTYLALIHRSAFAARANRGIHLLHGQNQDFGQSAWVGHDWRDPSDIDPLQLEDTLATRLRWGSRSIPNAGRSLRNDPAGRGGLRPVDLCPVVAAARDAHDGQSVYGRPGGGTRIGEQLASDEVSLFSDPHDPRLPTTPFVVAPTSANASSVFDNGLPLSRTDWIEDGVLRRSNKPDIPQR